MSLKQPKKHHRPRPRNKQPLPRLPRLSEEQRPKQPRMLLKLIAKPSLTRRKPSNLPRKKLKRLTVKQLKSLQKQREPLKLKKMLS